MPWYLIVLAVCIALPIAIGLVFKWLVAPIIIRNTQRVPIDPEFEIAAAEHFTPELRETLAVLLPQFEAEGFTVAAGLHQLNGSPGVRALQTTLVNRGTNDVAVIITTWAESARTTVIAVRSEFPDGRSIATGASRFISIYPPNPDSDYENFSWVRDVHTLCEVHRRRLGKAGKVDAPRVAPPPGDEIGYAEREWHREFARHVREGYHFADAAQGVYRYTWKGAFLATWKLTSPVKDWRIRLRDRRARRLWRELGMDTWVPPRQAVPAVAPAFASPLSDPAAGVAYPTGPSPLRYESTLPDGEVRHEAVPDGVTVHMGTPTVVQYLRRRWFTLVMIGFWALLLSWNVYAYLRVQALLPAGAGLPNRPVWYGVSILVMAGFLLNDLLRLVFAVLQLRGTTSVTATREGVTFRNVPALDHSGFIPRDQLEGLRVAQLPSALGGGFHTLHATLETGKRQPLLIGRDPVALETARGRLVQALGIESPAGFDYADAR